MRGVSVTPDFQRVYNLPVRTPAPTDELAHLVTQHLKTPQGTQTLRPIQAFALAEAHDNGGLFGAIGVGQGKTLISLLAPVVCEAKRPLLLIPPALVSQTERAIEQLQVHWQLHKNLKILSYSALSTAKNADILDRIAPDLIICDEVHNLKAPTSARTKRFLRFFKAYPATKLIALSGTITKKSLMDFWHLLKLTHKTQAPIPYQWPVAKDWDDAIGDSARHGGLVLAPGVLALFAKQFGVPTAREGYQQKLKHTAGVVMTTTQNVDASLFFTRTPIEPPASISAALAQLRASWSLPGGDEIASPTDFARAARQLACGFFYRWAWPDGKVDTDWLQRRSLWHRELRGILKRNIAGCDSPLLVTQAIKRGEVVSEHYAKWEAVSKRYDVSKITEAVWLDDYLMQYARAWAAKNTGIVWCESKAVLAKLGELGMQTYGPGPTDASAILSATGSFAASVQAHGTGRNLQRYSKNLVLCPPTAGDVWEQLIGRTHREGQQADEVTFEICAHTDELAGAIDSAKESAKYLQGLTGQPQKFLLAST